MSSSVLPPAPKYGATTTEDWRRGDQYFNSFLIRDSEDANPAASLENSNKNELPRIAVSKAQGKYLKLLIQALGAKRVLEVGTLGGYSALWMEQSIPKDGELITLEFEQKYSDVARENFKNAGVPEGKIKVIVGDAVKTMKTLEPPFDFVFIDAYPPNVPVYVQESKRLLKKGGVIVIDNVNRHGRVSNPDLPDGEGNTGYRELLKDLKDDSELEATMMGFAGQKGYDAYMFIVKN